MRFIGDIHGNLKYLESVLTDGINIQVGDFGFGFVKVPEYPNLKFIRGNHDNPELCYKSPMFLGDYGEFNGVFFVSGASSHDWKLRTPGYDCWINEELSNEQFDSAIGLWKTSDAKIFVSHDAPDRITVDYLQNDRNKTSWALQTMLEIKKPDIWIFGHHHLSLDFMADGVRWIGINKLQYRDIE